MAQGSDYISDGAWGGNNPDDFLNFEQPMAELEIKIRKLKANSDDSAESVKEIRGLQRQLKELTQEIYGNLSPWQTVQVARHKTARIRSTIFRWYSMSSSSYTATNCSGTTAQFVLALRVWGMSKSW